MKHHLIARRLAPAPRSWTRCAPILIAALMGSAAITSPAAAYDKHVYIMKTQDDKFSKKISFNGIPELKFSIFGATRLWNLRSWIDKSTLTVTHQLYVDISYSGSWENYEAAADDSANDLPFVEISNNVGDCSGLLGCDLREIVGIDLDDETLRAKALSGFQVKLSAKSGDSFIIDVTPAQIQSELLTANQFLPPERRWSAEGSAPQAGAANASPANQRPASGGGGTVKLGVSFADVTPALAAAINRPNARGVFVIVVVPDSSAARAGITTADIIDSFDGKSITKGGDLVAAVQSETPGRAVKVHIIRGGQQSELTVQF